MLGSNSPAGTYVTAEALQAHLKDAAWVVFDCRHDLVDHARGAARYAAGHIPGAHFVPFEAVLTGQKTGKNGRHPLPDAAAFRDFLARHGVTAESHVVAYDDSGGTYAARLWWLARWIGFKRVVVLDGGMSKCLSLGLPSTKEIPTPRVGELPTQPSADALISADRLQAGLASGTLTVVDARSPDRFRGEAEPIDRVAGHIPGALNRPFQMNLNDDRTVRSPEGLRREFSALLQGRAPGSVVHQCGSGVTACANLLAMEHAGLNGSKLYPGSWSEWIADPSRPIAIGS